MLAILNIIKSKIIQGIGEKKFSVQMDGTQDTATVEQETIILRYVLGLEVKERLFSVQKVYDTSAAGIFQLLSNKVQRWKTLLVNHLTEHQICVESSQVYRS